MTAHAPASQVAHFTLDNGLEVVVIPDHRAPVVTHMVWYRNGSADDPLGKSGIAHFLEHLMFKGTKAHPQGEFSESHRGDRRAGERLHRQRLHRLFPARRQGAPRAPDGFEADRMTGLVLTDEVVAPERDVVLEERRMHCDADPGAQLDEAVQATLFTHHPYGTPIIGWGHEIEGLDREDALAYYTRFYTPENAILIVAGDVDAGGDARARRAQTYGKIPPRGAARPSAVARRSRRRSPRRLVDAQRRKSRTAELAALLSRALVPHRRAGRSRGARRARAICSAAARPACSTASWCSRRRWRSSAGAYYMGSALDETRFYPLRRCRPPASASRRSTRRSIACWPNFLADGVEPTSSSAPRPAWSPTRSTPRTASPRWRAGTARRSPPARPSRTSQEWPAAIEAVDAEAVSPRRGNGSNASRAVTGFLLPQRSRRRPEAADVKESRRRESRAPEETR